MNPIFIAEIKTKSPFGFVSPHSFNKLMDTAIEHGDWISVHDNALWGGDYESIAFVRRCTSKPILAKGLHTTNDDIKRALDHGADYVLVVDRIPPSDLWERCLFEWSSYSRFDQTRPDLHKSQYKHVCNSRNLRTGTPRPNDLSLYLANPNLWICQASNILMPDDVQKGVSAFLVGENLVEFSKARKARHDAGIKS